MQKNLMLGFVLGLVIILGAPLKAHASSVDLDSIHYTDSGIEVLSDFSSGSIIPDPWPHMMIPVTNGPVEKAWWEFLTYASTPGATGLLDTANSAWRMSCSQKGTAISSFAGFGDRVVKSWTLEGRFKNFSDLYEGHNIFRLALGRSFSTPETVGAGVEGRWFSGLNQQGEYVKNVLILVAWARTPNNSFSWRSEQVVLRGLDPASVIIDLKAAVGDEGQTLHASYKLNDGSDWVTISEYTIPAGIGFMYGWSSNANLPAASFEHTFPAGVCAGTNLIADGGADGEKIKVGSVHVWQDVGGVRVTYRVKEPWCFTELHLAVKGSEAEIPQTKNGSPIPGQFEYSYPPVGHAVCHNEYTFPPRDKEPIKVTCPMVIAAHAVVKSGNRIETAWGSGKRFNDRNWSMYFRASDCASGCNEHF